MDAAERKQNAPIESDDRGTASEKGPMLQVKHKLVPALIAPIAIAGSLAGVFGLFRFYLPPLGAAANQAQAATETVVADVSQNTYKGVEDPWMMSGYFTVGNEDFDKMVKEFCDAFSGEGRTSADAARNLYNNIVWGSYSARDDGSKPFGRDWVIVSARIYFDSADPAAGEIGEGDFYEWAAALAFCMRYFGYSDAIAVPTVTYDDWGNPTYSAICYLTGEGGKRYILDPALGTEGWMIDAATRDILVDNIGQDISVAESYGLKVVEGQETGEVEAEETEEGEEGAEGEATEEGEGAVEGEGHEGEGASESEAVDPGGYVDDFGYDQFGNYVGIPGADG